MLLAIAAAGSGWLGGMGFLRVVHPWAYDTEFRWWVSASAAYAALLMLVIGEWIARSRPGATWRLVVGGIMRFGLSATILPLCLIPFTGGFSIVLLMTGHAYVIAAIAASIYLWTTWQ